MQNPIESADDDMEDREFWMAASAFSMAKIWGNSEDDVYAELLNRAVLDENTAASIEEPGDSASSLGKGANVGQTSDRQGDSHM
jgi:hypothetical protein